MTKEAMINNLNRKDLHGVGAIATTPDGTKQYYFYEDFENDKGIDRAKRHFDYFIDLGRWTKVEYIYKSLNNLYFIDYSAQDGNFTFNNFYRRYNKNFNIPYIDNFGVLISDFGGGLKVKYEHKPLIDGMQEIIFVKA